MKSITIITIVVVALLTAIIFWLTWIAYNSCLKAYKLEVGRGQHDTEILKEYHVKKRKKGGRVLSLIWTGALLTALSSLFIIGIIYRASGENIVINNKTALVIKSGSMSDFYDDELAVQYQEYNYDLTLQFDVGDICFYEKMPKEKELVEGEVYGYKYRNYVITHRLIKVHEDSTYEFRGDNNPTSDGILVSRENIIYHYMGKKIPAVGAFVLYAQSYFGVWSLISIIGVAISSEIVYYKIDKINKERLRGLFYEI